MTFFSREPDRVMTPSRVPAMVGVRQVAAGVEKIEVARRAAGVSVELLARRADLPVRSYRRYLAGRHTPGDGVVDRLEKALTGIVMAGGPPSAAAIVKALHGHVRAVAGSLRLDPDAAWRAAQTASSAGASGGVPGGHRAMQARREAIYLTAMEFDLPAAEVARAVGVTRQAVSRMLAQVEAAREDTCVDRRLAQLEGGL